MSANLSNPVTLQIYSNLPEGFYIPMPPSQPTSPALVELNTPLLESYGVSEAWFHSEDGIGFLSGNHEYQGASPLAMAYSGHQFGHWAPVLGDGRAHMLGQLATADGRFVDIQLKGSGRTPFSRGGDGKATLGAVIREYLISEAMAGLGIPTTRTLALLTTGEQIIRDFRHVPGAIQVRTATSHLRVGSFQYAHSRLGKDGVQALADFAIEHHFPALKDRNDRYAAFLHEVGQRQASLIVKWMLSGFIHGVMNTDNMSIVGESIDFGPCAFMDEFKSGKVFSSIDAAGRYAWNQQAAVGYWNLQRLAETLLELIDEDSQNAVAIAQEQVDAYIPRFQHAFRSGLKAKLGIVDETPETDDFLDSVLPLLEAEEIDFTLFFDLLTEVASGEIGNKSEEEWLSLFTQTGAGPNWLAKWQSLRSKSSSAIAAMRKANPKLIARNHQVEQAISEAMEKDDLTLFRRLAEALRNPYAVSEQNRDLLVPPQPKERVLRTFCGT